jgi:hypothetical protein
MACLFDRILILDARLKSEALRLSLARKETFDRYAAQHDAKMMTRFVSDGGVLLQRRVWAVFVNRLSPAPKPSQTLNHSTPKKKRLAR